MRNKGPEGAGSPESGVQRTEDGGNGGYGRGATGRRQTPTERAEPYRIASISSPTR